MAKDQTLVCVKCKNVFSWSVRSQEFYESQGYPPPKTCFDCRKRKERLEVVESPRMKLIKAKELLDEAIEEIG